MLGSCRYMLGGRCRPRGTDVTPPDLLGWNPSAAETCSRLRVRRCWSCTSSVIVPHVDEPSPDRRAAPADEWLTQHARSAGIGGRCPRGVGSPRPHARWSPGAYAPGQALPERKGG